MENFVIFVFATILNHAILTNFTYQVDSHVHQKFHGIITKILLYQVDSHVHQKFYGIITKKLSWLSSGCKIYFDGSFRLNCLAGNSDFKLYIWLQVNENLEQWCHSGYNYYMQRMLGYSQL